MLTVTAAVLSAVLLVAAVVLARDGGAPSGPTTPAVVAAANQAVRIDPGSLQAVAAVPVGTDPAAVVGGGGLVWVANQRDGTVSVIDPATNQVQQTIPASGSGPVGPGGPGVAYAGGSLWVANATQRQVARVESDADPVIIPVRGSPNAIVAAQDTAWVAAQTQSGGGLVARIDATSNQVHRPTVRLPSPPTGLAITPDGRRVWVASPADQAIRGIDPGAGRVVKRIELPQAPDQAVYGDGAVWVTSTTGDAVQRIDADTSKVGTPPIRVGNGPSGIAFGADRVWVANSQDGTLSTIDPQTNEVGTQRLGFQPTAVAVEERAVWVALAA